MKKIKTIIALVLVLTMLAAATLIQFSAAENPAFTLSSASGKANDEVTLTLSCLDNPGICSFGLNIAYDSESLEMVNSVESGTFAPITFSQYLSVNPYRVQWFTLNDTTSNGAIANLTFKIKDSAAAGDYTVSISYDEDEVCKAK